jgi:hypothetical protein
LKVGSVGVELPTGEAVVGVGQDRGHFCGQSRADQDIGVVADRYVSVGDGGAEDLADRGGQFG